MLSYKYLIIGGGMAAASAIEGIRDVDLDGSIGLISGETDPPYDRPPLSKGLWKGEPESQVWRSVGEYEVERHLTRRIVAVDVDRSTAVDDRGTSYGYNRLLLATGGTPRRMPFGGEDVIYFRTMADYRRLRALAATGSHFVVIGGGFIGSEIAAALAMNGKKVSMVFPEAAIGARVYPSDLAGFLSDYYAEQGVRLLSEQTVVGIEQHGGRQVVRTSSGNETVADGVVAGLGLVPNLDLARDAGLDVGSGIRVDESLRTSDPNVFAAGDVAEFYSEILGRWMRVEHEDNANTMGRHAGRAMAGQTEPYRHMPFFYSDMFDLGYEGVGILDSRLETVADWTEPYREGVIYYLGDERVRGILLWNVWEQVDAARRLIAEHGPFRAGDLLGRIPASALSAQAA